MVDGLYTIYITVVSAVYRRALSVSPSTQFPGLVAVKAVFLLPQMQASQDSGVAFLEETSFLPASLEAIPFPSVDMKLDLDGVATGMGELQVRTRT